MDKYEKYDENRDIFPDITIVPDVESLIGNESEEEIEESQPSVRHAEKDIFKRQKPPTISKDEPSEPIEDKPDVVVNEVIKRKGRGKDKKVRKNMPRTEAQLAGLAKAREEKAVKKKQFQEYLKKEKKIKMEIQEKHKKDFLLEREQAKQVQAKQVEAKQVEAEQVEQMTKPPKQVVKESVVKPVAPPPNINDFDTFCSFMNKYETAKNIKSAHSQAHPNKMVSKNLLPRPPLEDNAKNIPKVKKHVQTIAKPVYDPLYAINMLGRKRQQSFKDPFSR